MRPERTAPGDDGVHPPWGTLRTAGVLLGLLAITLVLSMGLGSVRLPLQDDAAIFLYRLTGGMYPANACPVPFTVDGFTDPCSSLLILWNARAAEVLLAILVGSALAVAGGTMQGVFRNPLADPYLLGISSGGGLGAMLNVVGHLGEAQSDIFLPLFAFLGAMSTALLVLAMTRRRPGSRETLLLTGVALAALFGSILTMVLELSPLYDLQALTFWLLGSFGAASWTQVGLAAAATLAGGALLALQGRDLNLLQIGDETARGLGCDVDRVRRRLLLLASFITAVAVAFSGIIAFVGLISPHVVRRLHGPDYRSLLPLAGLFGGLFMLVSDDVADTILGGGGLLPVGVVTAIVGAPFFLWVLFRTRRGTGP